jgi:hypothetical protein
MLRYRGQEAASSFPWPNARRPATSVRMRLAHLPTSRDYPEPGRDGHVCRCPGRTFVRYVRAQRRWACNKRFRRAMSTFADNSRHARPRAARVYADAIGRGCDHPHAVRVLGRAWIRVIYRCWLDGVPYDPAARGAASALTGPPGEPHGA